MAKIITIQLTKDEVDIYANKPINGRGGFQTLLKRIAKGLRKSTKSLIISMDDLEKIARYAKNYGQGGFQNRLEPLLREHRRIMI